MPVVATSNVTVGNLKGNQIGAQRILNDVFDETLLFLDDENHTFSYRIDDGPGPVSKEAVSNYIGRVRTSQITENNATFIEWQSSYDATYNRAVGELCNPIYQTLLKVLHEPLS